MVKIGDYDVVFDGGGGRLTVGGSLADAVRVAEDAEQGGRLVRLILENGSVRVDWRHDRGGGWPLPED